MLFTLVLFLLIQGIVSSDDGHKLYEECYDILSPLYNGTRNDIPDAEELKVQCPLTKKFLDCRILHFSTEFEPRYNLGDFIISKNTVEELCDENSYSHKVYTENVDCYRSMVNEWRGCHKIGEDVFSKYRSSSFAYQHTDSDELDEEQQELVTEHRTLTESRCLRNSYAAACIGTKVFETCGFEALNTFVDLFIGLRFENTFCGKTEDNPFIDGFINFLATENKIVESFLIHTMFQIDEDESSEYRIINKYKVKINDGTGGTGLVTVSLIRK